MENRLNAQVKISLIIPCFNEQDALPLFYHEMQAVCAQMPCVCEMIFVDDGSKDQTLAVLKQLADKDSRVRYLSFTRNFGKEAAMYAGFCHTDGDYAAVLDADLQDPPSLLPQMLEILQSGHYDSVAARRTNRKDEPPVRSWFARKFYRMMNQISDADIMDGARDFRLMKKEMVDAVVAVGEYNRFSKGIFGWIGFRTYWLNYEHTVRTAGKTKWSFWKLFRYGVDGIISFSQIPLSLASWFGIGMTAVAAVMLLFIIVRKLCFGDPVAGWASMVCVVIFTGGIQLFCMGVMGQYIAKIFLETKKRPHYLVAESNLEQFHKIG